MKKQTTKHDREYMGKVAELGCIVCRNSEQGIVPAAVHHIRAGQGLSTRASHYLTIPLCPDHHQHGGLGTAFHAGRASFEMNHGSELQLLAQTIELLHKA